MDLVAQVPYFPTLDGNVVAQAVTRAPGGVGANIAVGLASLGHRVTLLGALGDDDTGHFLCNTLHTQHVDTSSMVIRAETATYSCFIAVRPHGERVIYGLPGAAILKTPEELDQTTLQGAQALHIAPSYKIVALKAIEKARQQGLFISYTPADVWWPEDPTAVREVARQADLLIINRVEAADLTGISNPEQAIRQLLAWDYGTVAVTIGEEGVWVGNNGNVEHIPAWPRPETQDTTGAGDAFTAGMVTGMLMKFSAARAAQLGACVASLKLRASGAQAGLPSLDEALDLLSN